MGYKVRETIKAAIQFTWYDRPRRTSRSHHDQMLDTSGKLSDEWYAPYLLRIDEAPTRT